MTIVIIEDERLTAEDLADIIKKVAPQVQVTTILQSVGEAVRYFKNNPTPDLVFSDIQLGDGLSFDIFSEVDLRAPIIFCTAFDEYAIKAFNANGIHYVLKPFNQEKIKEAFDKYDQLKQTFSSWSQSLENIVKALDSDQQENMKREGTLLVYFKDSVIPVKLEDVALFYIKNEAAHLYTFDQKDYVINKTLDEIQRMDTHLFYRANRQYIVNRNAIKEASSYLSRKISLELNLPFNDTITISKEKMTTFLNWLRE